MEYNELEGTVAYGPLLLAPLEGGAGQIQGWVR